MQASKKTRIISIMAMIVFVIRIMLPFLATFSVASAYGSEDIYSVDQKILICTADGLKWISLDDLENDENSPKRHNPQDCFLCQIAKNSLKDHVQIEQFADIDSSFEYLSVDYFDGFSLNIQNLLISLTPPARAPPIFA